MAGVIDKVSTLRDGAASVAVGLALAAANLLYFLRDTGFTQPATWVRIVILTIAAALAAVSWAIWLRGKPMRNGSHFALTVGVAVGTAAAMYLGTALFVIHQRSQPIDVTLGKELAGREQVAMGERARGLLEDQLLVRRGGSLEPDDLAIQYEFYRDPDHPRAQYVVVIVGTAERGSPLADNLADDFDDEITATQLSDTTNVGESQAIAEAPGRMRCAMTSIEGEAFSICVYAYGVRSVTVIMPPRETEPESLASAMLADMLNN